MDASMESLCKVLIKPGYIRQGMQNIQTRNENLRILLEKRKLPKSGLPDVVIEFILQELSQMDSNNFHSNCGVGEREGRIYSDLVRRRHFGFAHGIGRSGDISEVQPKAAGSSLLYVLTRQLATHALNIAGISTNICNNRNPVLLMPLATGMSLAMVMLALKQRAPASARYVLFPRIDQKSCFKSILTAGLIPIVIENFVDPVGEMSSDMMAIEAAILSHRNEETGDSSILCVLSTTSCFAPRQPDLVDKIAVLCKRFGVGHVINNAYGLQCPLTCKLINRASAIGRVDAIVQSTDKNFMVPVGGTIISSPSKAMLDEIASLYPGRASGAPILDLFVTLLALGMESNFVSTRVTRPLACPGEDGYRSLLQERLVNAKILHAALEEIAAKCGEVLLPAPRNSISFAMTLTSLHSASSADVTMLGSQLFYRNVSGCRVIPTFGSLTRISGYDFKNWGSHSSSASTSYLTAACAIGLQVGEIDIFKRRLMKRLCNGGASAPKAERLPDESTTNS